MAVKTVAELKALWVTAYKPTQQDYADLFDSYLNIVDNPTPGWVKQTIQLTNDDVINLGTANLGYGYKLFDAQGADKIRQMSNLIIKFNHTGGTFPLALFEIYSETSTANIFQLNSNADAGGTMGYSNRVYYFNQIAGTGSVKPSCQQLNDNIFLYCGEDLSDYLGTATLIFDYREIDFS